MIAEQAIFTSITTSHGRGYHLVAQSPGVNSRLAEILCLWSPTHGALLSPSTREDSLNGFAAGDGWIVVSRSCYGGPEYSGRGGLQIVTRIVAVTADRLSGFANNLALFARLLFTLGHLRLPPSFPDRLPSLELPDRSGLVVRATGNLDGAPGGWQTAVRGLESEERVAMLGVSRRWEAVEFLLNQIRSTQRLEVSFTTGLKPSLLRPFRLQVLPTVEPATEQQLKVQGVHCINSGR